MTRLCQIIDLAAERAKREDRREEPFGCGLVIPAAMVCGALFWVSVAFTVTRVLPLFFGGKSS